MDTGKMKNMVVLKNLPSNIVDEAIVILKPNVKIKNLNVVDSKMNNYGKEESKKNSRNYIIDEAQMVISNYVSNIEQQKKIKHIKKDKKADKNQVLKFVVIIFAILGIVSYILRIV